MPDTPSPDTYEPLGEPPALPPRRGSELLSGLALLPEQRIRAFSAEQLELLVKHWLYETVRPRYPRVLVPAGPGDKGRDVVAHESATAEDPWENYQCKQYAKPLTPSDVWSELGKLVFWTSQDAFSVPRRYTFVAPLGCGAQLQDLLRKPEEIRRRLAEAWDTHCGKLCSYQAIETQLANFAFPPMEVLTAGQIVDDLKGSPIYAVLFGGGLTKPRPADSPPPEAIAPNELPYIAALLDAYREHATQPLPTAELALSHDTYGPHLRWSRREFYCAESLHEFSKDVLLAPDDFPGLQQQIHDGITHTVAREFPSGYERVLAVCEQATRVQIDDHPLKGDLRPADRAGICHQLANDGRVAWRRR
jgi:hypothetical protein